MNFSGASFSGPPMAMFEHVIAGCQCEGKRCTKCKQMKCIGAFHRDRTTKSGLKFKCKVCACKQINGYYQDHSEERKVYAKDYRKANPDKIVSYNQQYYQDNREQEIARAMVYWTTHPEQKERHLEWLQDNAEAMKAYSAKYALEHAEQIAAYRATTHYRVIRMAITSTRRTRKSQAGGSYTAGRWEALKSYYGYTCLACGQSEPKITLHADHVMPVSKLGTSNIENIQPLCELCNKHKGQKATDYRPRIEREV